MENNNGSNGNKSNKGLLIGLGILVLFIIIIIIVVVSKNKKSDTSDAEATLAALQAQANDPNTSPSDKKSLLDQIEGIANIINILKNPKAPATGTSTNPPVATGATWSPITTGFYPSTGICKNPAMLNKTLLLKIGSKNGEVCALQSYLNATKNAGLVNDGDFGSKTQVALINAIGKAQVTLNEILA